MAACIKFEGRDGNIYYECNHCFKTYIVEKPRKCPSCGRKFTEYIDEVEITHNHNSAIKALIENPDDKDAEVRLLEYGIKRLMTELI